LSTFKLHVKNSQVYTSLQMAADAGSVRPDQFALAAREGLALGVAGDPRNASAELGQAGLDLVVSHTVAAIRQAVVPRH
jgi:creatinine amidohydrolase/Fe(II)-dependent formamide hydrolase-like protein